MHLIARKNKMDIRINKTFASRDELDSYVKSRFGDDPNKNIDVVMELSTDEMKKLSLDESTTVHGVRVAEASNPEEVALGSIQRGVPSKFRKARITKIKK